MMYVRLRGDRRGGAVTLGPFVRVTFEPGALDLLAAVGHPAVGEPEAVATWDEHTAEWQPLNPKALGPYLNLDILPTQGA